MNMHKTAVVIGGTGLLGKAVCAELEARGYTIDPMWLSPHRPDVRDPHAFDALPARIDAAIYLAGINIVEPAQSLTEEQWDDVMDINVKGAFRFAQAAFAGMRAAGNAHFLSISSIMATHPYPSRVAYATSKAALEGMTRALAVEWGQYGICVNALRLGHLNGLMKTTKANPQLLEAVQKNAATGKLIEPKAVAKYAGWLLAESEQAVSGCIADFDPAYVINRWPV
jgi:NAD(P)-dependent dehydrogenase (short-subunit alcohol dehydrogenase family)